MVPTCPDGARMGTTVQMAYGPQMPHLVPILDHMGTIWAAHVGKELYVPTSIPDGPQMVYLGSIWALCFTAHM